MSPGERPAEKRQEIISRARKQTTWLPGTLSGGAGPGALCTGTVWSRHLLQAHSQGLGGLHGICRCWRDSVHVRRSETC